MKKLVYIVIALLTGINQNGLAQQTPAPAQTQTISITGATAHVGDGTIVENCTLVFEEGKITAMGADVTPQGKVINASGKHLYPGFIAPGKSLGLIEVNAVRASNDQDEIGSLIPHVRSLIAYNAESKVVESMRPNGVLLGQVTPQGGRISGTSSIVQFDAWNWEDAAVKVDDGIHLNWPSTFRRGRWWLREPRGYQPNKDYKEQVDEVLSFLKNARVYGDGKAQSVNPAFEASQGLFDGSKTLYVYAQDEKQIVDAITALKEADINKIVLVGGYHAHRITGFLKTNNIPVLVNFTHSLPEFDDDDYDMTYKLPKLLVDGGLLVGLQNAEASNFQTRNLPFYAGQV
ncbi:MAG: amidohydrolase, partial [Eudoraea sp.]|nr:amidohydrolase [Eudoraea sp.]NNJ40051.1 amidohydrolase [Eudoraea sp.]